MTNIPQETDFFDLAVNRAKERQSASAQARAQKLPAASFFDRLKAAFKFSDEGVENFLRIRYGNENVRRDKAGEFLIAPNQEELPLAQRQFVPFDPKEISASEFLNDIADIAPAIGATIAGGVAAAATGGGALPLTIGTAARLAGTGAAADIASQATGALIPGEEEVPLAQRAMRAVTAGASEAIGPAASQVLAGAPAIAAGGAREAAKRAIRAPLLGSEKQREVAQETAKRVFPEGVNFSMGESGGKNLALETEGFLRRNYASAGIVRQADEAKTKALATFADKAIRRLGTTDSEQAAKNAVSAFKAHIENLDSIRASTAKEDFGRVEKLARGDSRLFSLNNTMTESNAIIDDLRSEFGDDTATRVAKWLESKQSEMLGAAAQRFARAGIANVDIDPSAVRTTVSSMRNALRIWGKRASDPRGLIEQVNDPQIQKMVASRIFGALKRDLDDAAENPNIAQDVAQAIKTARDNYRRSSMAIEEATDNPIASLVDNPTKLIDKFFVKNAPRDELRGIMNFLDETDPKSANELRGGILARALQSAETINAGDFAEDVISPAKLATTLKRNDKSFRIAFGGNQRAAQDLADIRNASSILARRLGGGSQTQPLQAIDAVFNTVAAAGGFSLGGYAGAVGSLAAQIMAKRTMARLLMENNGPRAYADIFKAAVNPSSVSRKTLQKSAEQLIQGLARIERTSPQNMQPATQEANNGGNLPTP